MSIIYGIISIPITLGALWWIFNLLFSPIIVANNVLNEFFPAVKVEKPSDIPEKLEYSPKYEIEDPFGFEEEVSKLQEGDLIFEDGKVYRFTKE